MARGDKIRLAGRRAYQPNKEQDTFSYYRNKLVLHCHDNYTILVCLLTKTTAIKFSSGPYQNSRKEPDAMLRPGNQAHPSIVVESGWTESYNLLESDMRLWLLGSPDVKVVLILNWTKPSQGRVKGTVEAFSRDVNGQPYKRQHAVCTFHPISCCILIHT